MEETSAWDQKTKQMKLEIWGKANVSPPGALSPIWGN